MSQSLEIDKLTERELDVLACIVRGQKPAEISEFLNISASTIKFHTNNILTKLQYKCRNTIMVDIQKTDEYAAILKHYKKLLYQKTKKFICAKTKSGKLDLPKVTFTALDCDGQILRSLKEELRDYTQEEKDYIDFDLRVEFDKVDIYHADELQISIPIDQGIEAIVFQILGHFFPEYHQHLEDIILTFYKLDNVDFAEEDDEEKSLLDKLKSSLPQVGLILLYVGAWFYESLPYKTECKFISHLPQKEYILKRSDLIKAIHKKLHKDNKNIQILHIKGPGGAGKTTLARLYADQATHKLVWEINAENEEGMISSFENLAVALAATEKDKNRLSQILEIEDAYRRLDALLLFVKRKLQKKNDWLLVFDDVKDPNLLYRFLPICYNNWGSGKVIVTSRQALSNIPGEHVIIPSLTVKEKTSLFKQIMGQKKVTQSKEFLDQIPPYPLDTATAAHYIKNTNISLKQYVEYSQNIGKNFATLQNKIAKSFSLYAQTRQTIVRSSLERICNENPKSIELLTAISYLHRNVPIELLYQYSDRSFVDLFIYNMKNFSLIDVNEEKKYIHIHQSIHSIIKDFIQNNRDALKISKVADGVIKLALSKSMRNINFSRLCRPHLRSLFEYKDILDENTQGKLYMLLGRSYLYVVNYKVARSYFETALTLIKDETLRGETLVNYGMTFYHSLELKKAREILSQANDIFAKNKDLNNQAWVLIYLGNTHRKYGEYETAKKMFLESIRIHEDVLHYYNTEELNLAYTFLGKLYARQGKFYEGLKYFKKALTNSCSNNVYSGKAQIQCYLSEIYSDLGQYDKAEYYLDSAYKIYKENLGDNHPYSFKMLIHMGNLARHRGNFEKAHKLFKDAYEKSKAIHGDDHPLTAWSLSFLGKLYYDQGKIAKAATVFKKSNEVLGPLNEVNQVKKTFYILKYKVRVLMAEQKYEEIVTLIKESLPLIKQSNGEENIIYGFVYLQLTEAYIMLKEYGNAVDAIKRAIDTYNKFDSVQNYKCYEVFAHIREKQAQASQDPTEKMEHMKRALYNVEKSLITARENFPKDSDHIKRLESLKKSLQI